MGTSKGYIAPKKPEWSNAKRAVSTFLRNRDAESKSGAVSKYAEAMITSGASISTSFSSAAGNILGFVSGVGAYGLNDTLHFFGRDDLVGLEPDVILNELLNQFTNDSATMEDSLAAEALSQAFDNLDIETIDDLGTVDIDILLREMVTEYININFDLRFEEKIGKGRAPSEKNTIMEEMHNYIADTIHDIFSQKVIKELNLSNIGAAKVVQDTLSDAFNTCINYYGDIAE